MAYEMSIEVLEGEFSAELWMEARNFLEDLEVSTEIDLETWKTRPLHKRVAESATEVIRQSL